MPSEPNHNIEDLLKAYAQQRREQAGAPLEMHSATRKLLQDEVQRQFTASPKPRSMSALLNGLWLRLAFAALVLVTCVGLLYWHGYFRAHQLVLAQNDKLPKPASSPMPQLRTHVVADQSIPLANAPSIPGRASPVAGRLQPADRLKSGEIKSKSDSDSVKEERAPAQPTKDKAPEIAIAAPNTLTRSESAEGMNKTIGLGYAAPAAVPPSASARGSKSALASAATEKKTSLSSTLTNSPASGAIALAQKQQVQSSSFDTGAKVLAKSEAIQPSTPPTPTAATLLAEQPASRRLSEVELAQQAYKNLGTSSNQTQNVTRRFQQVDNRAQYRRNLLSPPVPRILTTFTLERHGQKVRVVDGDGSIYEGDIVSPPTGGQSLPSEQTRSQQRSQQTFAVDNLQTLSAGAGFSFRVAGPNRHLNQNIVFNGVFVPNAENQLNRSGGLGGMGGGAGVPAQRDLKQAPASQNLWINGRVQVGGTNEFTIDAMPVQQ